MNTVVREKFIALTPYISDLNFHLRKLQKEIQINLKVVEKKKL